MRAPLYKRTLAAALAGWMLLSTSSASAFKIKTHVYSANIAMADIVDGGAYLPGLVTAHKFDETMLDALGTDPLASVQDRIAEACALLPEIECSNPSGPEVLINNPELL